MSKIFLAAFYFCFCVTYAQHVSLSPSQKKLRRTIVIGSTAGFATGSLIFLSNTWYSDYNTGQFHFFNDNKEWLQMDKLGHAFSAYHSGRLMMDAFRWAG